MAADPKAPYLIVAAFWSQEDVTDAVADAIDPSVFPRAEGRRGAVVSFRDEIASAASFQRVMERLDLAETAERDVDARPAV